MTKYEEFMKSTAKEDEVSFEKICYAVAFLGIGLVVAITVIGIILTAGIATTETVTSSTVAEDKGPILITIPEDIEIVVPSTHSRVEESSYHWDPSWLDDLHTEEHANQSAELD